ncbi:MAG: 4-alpha-glucanotransferase, partial [Geminicoccaceae bacterium]
FWTIVTEDGNRFGGEARVDELSMIEQTRGCVRPLLPLMADLPLGYHQCSVVADETALGETSIIITPKRAYWPDGLGSKGGLIGVTAPLYGLRSERNAGVGDFADLSVLAEMLAPLGAAFVGINPVHALFPGQPGRISPYAPSSRTALNVLMIALDRVPELSFSEKAQAILTEPDIRALLQTLRASELVDYPEVAALKLNLLEALFEAFLTLPPTSKRRADFQTFVEAGDERLRRHARFEALSEHILRGDAALIDWHDWPAAYRDPESESVQAFAEAHSDRVTFYAYLQWLARDQLGQAQANAKETGMALGLYLDLAVGVAPDGAEAWSDQDLLVNDARIGAPPDDFNPDGQNWGLLPLSPNALRARGYRPFVDMLRGTMCHAGALRIDHVLGLARSFWLPVDRDVPGAYIRYPMQDLLGLVALESHRQHCIVIGEDLGTVPASFRDALDEHGLLGCRLLYFESVDQGDFRPASAYPRACIASIGTHDLPTIKGFWVGRDIDWRERLHHYAEADQAAGDRRERRQILEKLLRLLAMEDLLPEGIDPDQPPTSMPQTLVDAFHRFLGRTPAALKAIQLGDVVGAIEQANLPGTIDIHPNWRRKIAISIEDLASGSSLSVSLAMLAGASNGTLGIKAEPSLPCRAGDADLFLDD